MNDLRSWSWQDIIAIYRIIGSQLEEYARLKKAITFDIPVDFSWINIDAFWYQHKFNEGVARLNAQEVGS